MKIGGYVIPIYKPKKGGQDERISTYLNHYRNANELAILCWIIYEPYQMEKLKIMEIKSILDRKNNELVTACKI